jgi:RimJ/RimL family protein N-acetyltransferase
MNGRRLPREIHTDVPAVLAVGPPPRPTLAAPWNLREILPGTTDSALLVKWMTHPHVREFWDQAWPAPRWDQVLSDQRAGDFSRPYLVLRDDRPFAYLEIYRTPRDVVSRCYRAEPHDLGLHLAIGALDDTGRGLGRELLRELAPALLLADPACDRVLAEPDARNLPAQKMFVRAGFRFEAEVDLGHKTAALMVHDRAGAG